MLLVLNQGMPGYVCLATEIRIEIVLKIRTAKLEFQGTECFWRLKQEGFRANVFLWFAYEHL